MPKAERAAWDVLGKQWPLPQLHGDGLNHSLVLRALTPVQKAHMPPGTAPKTDRNSLNF